MSTGNERAGRPADVEAVPSYEDEPSFRLILTRLNVAEAAAANLVDDARQRAEARMGVAAGADAVLDDPVYGAAIDLYGALAALQSHAACLAAGGTAAEAAAGRLRGLRSEGS